MQTEDYAHLYALEEDFWWFTGMREITAALLDPVCPPAPGKNRSILDAGCGTGGNLTWLERYAGSGPVVGIDLISDALQFCRARAHPRLTQASVTDLPFADANFDLLTSFDVLVQLPGARSDERAMREMYRVLRPGGSPLCVPPLTSGCAAAMIKLWVHSGVTVSVGWLKGWRASGSKSCVRLMPTRGCFPSRC